MIYDRYLQQNLDHEHPLDPVEIEDIDGLKNELQGIVNVSLSHKKDLTNPHQVSASQVGNSKAQWNADKIQDIPVDLEYLKHGWALGFNGKTKKFELFPFGDERFFEHDKLRGYDDNKHRVMDDSKVTEGNIWSSMKVIEEIQSLKNEILQLQNNQYNLYEGGSFDDEDLEIRGGTDFTDLNINNLSFGIF